MAEPSLRWHPARVVAGHGVASGRAPDSPYPAGTIALQAPLFAAHGVDLSPFYPGTLNLSFSDSRWRLSDPDVCVERLHWTEHHPPETFSFWRVALRWLGLDSPVGGLLYWPHPETKCRHHQPPDRLEVLAPWIGDTAVLNGLELGVDPRRCRRLQPLRLQARLLEALKFRVLASQEGFFDGFGLEAEAEVYGPELHGSELHGAEPWRPWPEAATVRRWLATVCPEALDLSDRELYSVLQRSRSLYCEGAFGSNGDNGSRPSGLR